MLFLIINASFIEESLSIENRSKKPNILLFLTDDQDSELDGTEPIRKTRSWLEDNGATFVNSFVSLYHRNNKIRDFKGNKKQK